MGVLVFLITILLALFSASLMTSFVTKVIKLSDGDNPASRAVSVFAGIITFCGYGYWAMYKTLEFWSSTTSENLSPFGMIFPLALPWVLIIGLYIFKGKNNKGNNDK